MAEASDTRASFFTGSKASIGTAQVQLTATKNRLKRGLVVKAAHGNAGTVYVGLTGVTADDTEATDGFPLTAGESVMVEVTDPSLVFCIASDAGHQVFFLGV